MNGEPTLYSLDLAAGLTQVLSDADNAYLYGVVRIGEQEPDGWQYHLGDALGSVRQLTESIAEVSHSQSYEPYGSVRASDGSTVTSFQYAGEHKDNTSLSFLRARYLHTVIGRFTSHDELLGDPFQPMSLHPWLYVQANPINLVDPSGALSCRDSEDPLCGARAQVLLAFARSVRQLVMWGGMLPVEALSNLVGYSLSLFDRDIEGMMWGTTSVLLGVDPNETFSIGLGVPFSVGATRSP